MRLELFVPLLLMLCWLRPPPGNAAPIGWLFLAAIVAVAIERWVHRPRQDHESALDSVLDETANLKKNWDFARETINKMFYAFVTADHITWSRVPLAIATATLYFLGCYGYPELVFTAFLVHAVNGTFDFVDGVIALKRGGSEFGKILDPAVDKGVHAFTLGYLALSWILSGQWLLLGVFLPPMAISLTYAYWLTEARMRKKGRDVAAKPHGKLKTVCECFATCIIMLARWSTSPGILLVDAWLLLSASCFLAHRSLRSQLATA